MLEADEGDAGPAAGTEPSAERPPRRQPETLRLRAFTPSLTVADLARSIEFYAGTLGFVVVERWTREGEQVGAMLRAGACELSLIQDDWKKGRRRARGEAMRIWCETDQDIDAVAERARSAGGIVVDGPREHSWGARGVALDDPDGFHLTIYRRTRAGR
jgi:catechol 2,3-dioxygenase-like lactoylglutathione lyase family enzyme